MRLEVLTELITKKKKYFSWGLRGSVVWHISSNIWEEYTL
jgi:hypothetical protein